MVQTRQPRLSRAANTLFRRQQIVDATLESVSTVGFAETTLAKVASIAGLSQGIVVFRFGTKEELLIEALRYLAEEYRQAWTEALEAAGPDPIERLCAFVDADFQPKLISKKKLAVWHAFYGEAKGHPTYLDICSARDEEHTAALRAVVSEIATLGQTPAGFDVDAAVSLIQGLSDGLWLQMLLSRPDFKRGPALDLMYRQLEILLPAHAGAIRLHRKREAAAPPAKPKRLRA
jgi:TetR/AcrR family transcriptional repressor of bet genes